MTNSAGIAVSRWMTVHTSRKGQGSGVDVQALGSLKGP